MAPGRRNNLSTQRTKEAPLPVYSTHGRDELNLAEFPFAILQYQRDPSTKTVTFSDTITGKDGQAVERHWTVTGSDAHGLPVAGDVDIVIALLALTHEQGMKSREVFFTRYDLLRIMGWGHKGRNYGRVKEGLDRLTGTTIKAEQAFYDKEKQAYLTRSFHIIDDYDLWDRAKGHRPADPARLPLKSIVTWNQHIFQSLKAGYVKRLDTGRFFRLSTPIAKQLFRYLDKKFYRDRGFQIDIFKLSHEHLGISRSCRHVSKLRGRLNSSLEELVRDGYLESYEYAPSRSNRRSVTVRFLKAATAERMTDPSTPATYFYQQLSQRAEVARPIPNRERELAATFVGQHGFDIFREFVDYVMHEKSTRWPDLATLTGAFMAFEDPFVARLQDREVRQEEVWRERRKRDDECRLNEGYAHYLQPIVDRIQKECPQRFSEFKGELAEFPEYKRCLLTLRRLNAHGGPLSKAARDQAEVDRQNIFNRSFAECFRDEGVLDLAGWRDRNGTPLPETNDARE